MERGSTVDVYHGTRVADPYRALEAADDPATQRFVAAQNRLAQPWLEALPQRAWIASRLEALWRYERVGLPRKEGGRYFFLRNDGRQDQSVLWWTDALQAAPRPLVDPNASRADATVAIARFEPSPDGKVVAYALSDGGTDWEIWKFRRVDDGVDLPDELRFTKFWDVSWSRDGRGVWYSRYAQRPARDAAAAEGRGDDQAQPVVHFHRLGEPQSADRAVYAVTDHPTRAPSARVTDDGRWLVVSLFDGYERNAVDLLELGRPGAKPRRLFGAWDALYTVIGSEGDTFWVQTTQAAPRGRVIAVDARDPRPARWREVVPQSDAALVSSSLVGSRLVANYVRDARGVARLFEKDGRPAGEVPVPGLGTIEGFAGHGDDPETFFTYADYLTPARVLRYDTRSNQASVFRAPQVAADTSRYVTRQVFFASRDGTRVPMFVTHRRDLVLDGSAPTLLYGYGGFSISLTPAFRPATLTWLEMGGVYAEANLRGGGEYGEAWHQAGTKTRKQNVFDDFVAAAEWLVAQRYTRPSRLAISGRSNGGLLVGAVLTQRPDLFGAALPAVGVLDMLRYHTASANARQWSSDYGLSEVADQFRTLLAYSPVHNVRDGRCYPPTLVTTADRDDRVVPWHSYKFAAALQHAQGCPNPVLLRVETRAGHGAGKPVWMQIEDYADQWAFAAQALGIALPPPAPAVPGDPRTSADTPSS
ncbi:MAG: prolyl oligopeptidase family serine peptidase [Steroidobacteraceae bacterium]|nr:prolyl oligopeptidase family serine peptidase [Steroidobacteraceae bacterium]